MDQTLINDLHQRVATAERQRDEAQQLLAIGRESAVLTAARVLELERLAAAINQAAAKNPFQALSRWVNFGPEADLLKRMREAA